MALTPIRRVVTGNDAQGRSTVSWDGPAPGTHETAPGSGRGYSNLWVYETCPAPLSGPDDGDNPYEFPAAKDGGHFRVVENKGRQPGYDPLKDPEAVGPHEPRKREVGQTWERGGQNAFSSAMHMTESVDYGITLEGDRDLILDDRTLSMKAGDVVVQLGDWHQWSAPRVNTRMAFLLIGADFRAKGAPGGPAPSPGTLPEGVKPVRRIVCINDAHEKGTAIADGPSPDVRTDPARPGFAATRIWVTDSTPAKTTGVRETLQLPHSIEPPPAGSLCRFLTIPPDSSWQGRVGEREVRAYFQAMGSPGACSYSAGAPHPYMQKTRSLDFVLVVEGEITLVLDMQQVGLKATDVVIQRGTNHAWSNLSNRPAVIAICSVDGK